VGRRVGLRGIDPTDYDFLYHLATDPERSWRWRFRGATPSPERFVQELYGGVLTQFIAEALDTREPLGHLVAYDARIDDGTCHFAILGTPRAESTGLLIEATILFLGYLFDTSSFRKLYAEIPAFTMPAIASSVSFLTEEGRLREYAYYGGRYWDTHILAVSRDEWAEVASRAQRFLRRGAVGDRTGCPPDFESFVDAVGQHIDADLSHLTPRTALADAGFDSIVALEIDEWLAVELGVELPEDLIATIDSVGELYDWVRVKSGST
jgi:RimJ/RimL family protein N-acetyltransferase/acyl carrier protein